MPDPGIAIEIESLLRRPGVKERFQEHIHQAAGAWVRQHDDQRQREQARANAMLDTGVPYNSGQLPEKPSPSHFHWVHEPHDGSPVLEAWLPAELSPDLDPSDSLPLPIPRRILTTAEICTVLAAIWDAHEPEETLNPWVGTYSREGTLYANLVHVAKTDAIETLPIERVKAWVDDVKAALLINGEDPKSTPTRPAGNASALLDLYTNGLADKRIQQAQRIVGSGMATNEKLMKLDALVPIPATASAKGLGAALGVSKQAVLKSEWWKDNRRGEKADEIGRRGQRHQQRARDYEPQPADDDEDE
jgi:hypothetical protein